MINSTNMVEFLTALAGILGTIAVIVKSAIEIAKKLPILMNIVKKSSAYKFLLKVVVYLLFFLTLAIPNGMIVWWYHYQVAKNPRQILEPSVFLLVIFQITLFVSLYSLAWGVWLVPALRRVSQNHKTTQG
jgi:hypothetical protein